jgi:sulfate permease, SulP family
VSNVGERARLFGGILPYQRNWLAPDVIAGVTAAAVVIPQAMGYATVAGLPVEIGLYTCIFPLAVYAVMGGSRRLSFSTTSTIVALTGLALTTVGVSGSDDALAMVATLTAMVGISLLLFRLIRLGWMVEAVSEAVVDGLKVGVGFTIIAEQLPKLLGISEADGGFIADVGNAFTELGSANVATVVLSVGTIAGLLILKKLAPRVPGPLVAVLAGILLVAIGDITARGVEVIPSVPTGLPLPSLPELSNLSGLLPFALAIAFMSYFESITAARIARQPGDRRLDNDHEYVAVGIASLAGSLFQTVPPAGGFSQTQVNTEAGAKTQVSELITAGLAILVALFLAPVLSDLPEATLGSVVTVSVIGLVSFEALSRLGRISRLDFGIAVFTALAALVGNLLIGVAVGVFLTFYFVLRALNHPVVFELRRPTGTAEFFVARPGDPPIPGVLILRVEGGMYTMNIRRIQDEVYRQFEEASPAPHLVVVDVGATVDTSVTVIDVWLEIDQHLADQGAILWFAGIPPRAQIKAERTRAYQAFMAAGRIHPSVITAVETYRRGGTGIKPVGVEGLEPPTPAL